MDGPAVSLRLIDGMRIAIGVSLLKAMGDDQPLFRVLSQRRLEHTIAIPETHSTVFLVGTRV
jgi:hypothetical protein